MYTTVLQSPNTARMRPSRHGPTNIGGR